MKRLHSEPAERIARREMGDWEANPLGQVESNSPSKRMKPPRGIQLSVTSVPRTDPTVKRRGGKPIPSSFTLTPHRKPTRRCPNSCRRINPPRIAMKMSRLLSPDVNIVAAPSS
jgi:hypothetical protein